MQKGKPLHHAYCLVGDAQTIVPDIYKQLEQDFDFPVAGNPDFRHSRYDVLKVDDARAIAEAASILPVGERKVSIVETNLLTLAAQNALLKVFEEPKGNTHFFLIIPSSEGLLPTLLSRMERRDMESDESSGATLAFLGASTGERLSYVRDLAEAISDEKQSKMHAIVFLGRLIEILRTKGDLHDLRVQYALREIEQARQYASEQSPSLKMLLEHIALVTPTFSK